MSIKEKVENFINKNDILNYKKTIKEFEKDSCLQIRDNTIQFFKDIDEEIQCSSFPTIVTHFLSKKYVMNIENDDVSFSKMEKEEIVINKMYTGGYLDDHLGHEVTNLYKADNGKNYIYIQPYGGFSKIHNNRIKAVLLTQGTESNDTQEVLGVASDLEQMNYDDYIGNNKLRTTGNHNYHDNQIRYIRDNEVKYGNVLMNDLFDDDSSGYITFEAKNVKKVREGKRIFITTRMQGDDGNKIYIVLEGISFPKTSPKMYFSSIYSSRRSAYDSLNRLINNKAYWEDKNTTKSISVITKPSNEYDNYLKIIRKQDDEVIASNMLAFYLKNKNVWKAFANQVLKLKINVDDNYKMSIHREEKNIDLIIRDSGHLVVIENKIKSGLNGITRYESSHGNLSQLDKYYKYANRDTKEKDDVFFDSDGNREKVFCVIAPEYNLAKVEHEIEEYTRNSEPWLEHVISYKTIKDAFKDLHIDMPYWKEFMGSLERHSRSIDNDNFDRSNLLLKTKIFECNNSL